MNWILLRGKLSGEFGFSHTAHDKDFFAFWMDVPRLSGHNDRLRVLLTEEQQKTIPQTDGWIEIQGQIRSFNNKSGIGSRLIVSALAKSIRACAQEPCNRVLLSGTLCREPIYRRTPLGREICDIMLAVPRGYGRTDYLPIIAWGQTARICAEMQPGRPFFAEGRFQSRQYTKMQGEEAVEKTAFEISIIHTADSEEALLLGSDPQE